MTICLRGLAVAGLCLIFSSAGLMQDETQAKYFPIWVLGSATGEARSGGRGLAIG
jgi:hypothetical protein